MKAYGEKAYCLFRITENDWRRLERLIFGRYPDEEWGAFFRFGYRITSWGFHVTFVDSLDPRPGELDERSGIVEFAASYILRAQLALGESMLGVGVVHSHPEGCSTGASALDRDMDGYFSKEFSIYGEGRPYVSLRVSRRPDGRIVFSGEAWIRGNSMPILDILISGSVLLRERAEYSGDFGDDQEGKERTERLSGLIGPASRRLSRAVVGIVGCSGLGSPAAHVLVRAGVRHFVLIDPKPYSPSNSERLHGSNWRDAETKPLKVEIVQRLLKEIDPRVEVKTIAGNVLDDEVLDELLLCDVVIGATDSQHSRAAMGDYASHYLLPCIDAAVLMRAKDGLITEQVAEIARYTAEEPCPWCLGRINQRVLAYELMTDEEREQRAQAAADAVRRGLDGEQYWGKAPPQELTVGYLTTMVGAMQAGYAELWITGAGSMPHQRFQFDPGMPLLGAAADPKVRRPECSCNRTKGWGDQARVDRSVTRPHHWA